MSQKVEWSSYESVSKEGRGHRRGEPSDIATLRWFPSPKDLHVLNPKRFLNASFACRMFLRTLRKPLHLKACFSTAVRCRRTKCLYLLRKPKPSLPRERTQKKPGGRKSCETCQKNYHTDLLKTNVFRFSKRKNENELQIFQRSFLLGV